ncbi:UNVERIFIED_CONTAM: hypothetical protein FKN15_010873, partial [Acipenser sinensis]
GFSGCGIIYCRTRDSCGEVANKLTQRGILSKAYHAGLKAGDRATVQNEWMEGKVPVIVATISFGMGVDKANVRFVAHWNIAKSMAGYYQESGRAGRDGAPSCCRLYYSRTDQDQLRFLITKEISMSQAKRGTVKDCDKATMEGFEALVAFCEQDGCHAPSLGSYLTTTWSHLTVAVTSPRHGPRPAEGLVLTMGGSPRSPEMSLQVA